MTSPARADVAGALDPSSVSGFTELRVHGVGGSTGPVMLEHPHALQVGGDRLTMFLRRWTPDGRGRPAVPWRLEAYSWGGLTERAFTSALWILLAPFMIYNVAHFALLPSTDLRREAGGTRVSRDGPHAAAAAILRMLAASATVQFVLAPVVILLDCLAWQGPAVTLRSWLGWYVALPSGLRLVMGMVGVAVVLAGLWVASVRTAVRYEQRTATTRDEVEETTGRTTDDSPSVLSLSQPRFWNGAEVVHRQRSLHTAAALAVVALVVAMSSGGEALDLAQGATIVLAGLCLLAVLVVLGTRIADRHHQALVVDASPGGGLGRRVCRSVLALAAVAFVASGAVAGWPATTATASHPTMPGLVGTCASLLVVQGVLVVSLAGSVFWISCNARRVRFVEPADSRAAAARHAAPDPSTPEDPQLAGPFAAGQLATVAVVLAVCAGATLTALVAAFANQLLVASGAAGVPGQRVPAELPWPVDAAALVPVGAGLGLLVAGGGAALRWSRNVRIFNPEGGGTTAVGAFYAVGDAGNYADDAHHGPARSRAARAWATGLLVDGTGALATWLAVGMVVALGFGEIAHFTVIASPGFVASLVALESLLGVALGGVVVGLLRSAYRDPARRRTVGTIWDVGTFWPRACHPLAPPSYAERAVPELVDRLRLLTGSADPARADTDSAAAQIADHTRDTDGEGGPLVPTGPVLLTGYSQGAVITPAVIALLPATTLSRTSLLTLASPARRLYGRAFPAYFGPEQLDLVRELLSEGDDIRWRNLVRRSDYIGSWVFDRPGPRRGPGWATTLAGVDVPAWDPVVVAHDADQAPPPIHRHSQFWPDARVAALAGALMDCAEPRSPRAD